MVIRRGILFVGQVCEGASTTLLDESDVVLHKLLMFPFCKGCHLDLECCKMINEAVKLIICHYHLDIEAVLVVA